jgi:hypothetical protein
MKTTNATDENGRDLGYPAWWDGCAIPLALMYVGIVVALLVAMVKGCG